MKKRELPKVVIVGRMNVGKSTLFNRLSTEVKSLTMDYEGVTRDFLTDTVCWQDHCFELIDTGGISLRKTEDSMQERVRQLALSVLEKADVVLFVCDGKVGIVPEDREIARLLHKLGKKTVLLVNKIDAHQAQEQVHEFQTLGFDVIPMSAQHGLGISDLFDELIPLLPKKMEEAEDEAPQSRIVILGKPNVGKSSLLNVLVEQERALVADEAGTTREAITESIRFYQEDIKITDTPGLRRKRKVTEPIEKLMTKSALNAIGSADIVLLVIDASEGGITDQELKLAFYAFEEKHKALIVLFNKSDLLDETMQADLDWSLEPYDHLFKKIPQLYISCKTGKNIGKIIPLVHEVNERYRMRFSDEELTYLFKEALTHRPLYRQGEMLVLYGAQQVATAPPSIAMRVNHPHLFGPTQYGFFDGQLRRVMNLKGVPVRFFARSRRKK